tara:strand:+ start:2896 stop:3144 length:249 start_codon:yes stop_codon:yes gene_type:complete
MILNKKQKKVFLKCAEELNELSTKLLQEVNKKDKCRYNDIVLESQDVDTRLEQLKYILNIKHNFPNYNEHKLMLGNVEDFKS